MNAKLQYLAGLIDGGKLPKLKAALQRFIGLPKVWEGETLAAHEAVWNLLPAVWQRGYSTWAVIDLYVALSKDTKVYYWRKRKPCPTPTDNKWKTSLSWVGVG